VVAALLTGLVALADATAPAPAAHPAAPSGLGGMLNGFLFPMLLIFGVFYFMLIRPQQKKQKEQTEWLKNLKKGDEVVTTGGLIGRITGLTDNTVTLEVQEKVRLKVVRSHIAGKPPAPGAPAPAPVAAAPKPPN
jgi:preprotein translocase subunit YajC